MQQQSAVRELQIHAFRAFEDLQRFAKSEEFVGILEELYSLPSDLRHEFVVVALMDDEVLRSRGIFRPADIIIQRSEFEDKRPTLFCISRNLPPGLGWKKVTITFDNSLGSGYVPVIQSALEKYTLNS